ncbi:MAG: type II secretion system F family protein [Actinomycetes bacterium]
MTRTLLRLGVATMLVVGSGLAGVGTASAAPSGNIVGITTADGQIDIVFQADDLPEGASIDPGSVTLEIEGTDVPATAEQIGAGTDVKRAAVLAIDVSQSMRGPRIADAQAAARTFLETVPADVLVGLVTFGKLAETVQAPTEDRAAVALLVDQLEVDTVSGTALYDGSVLAADAVGESGARSVIVLSDGHDSGSTTRLPAAVTQIKEAGVALDSVYIGPSEGDTAALAELTAAGDGTLLTSGSDDLAATFKQAAQAIGTQIQISGAVPQSLVGTSANVTVTAMAGEVALIDSAAKTLTASTAGSASPFGPRPVDSGATSTWVTESMLPFALGATFLGLLFLVGIALTKASKPDTRAGRVRRRLSIYTLTGRVPVKQEEITTALGSSQVARSAVEFAGKVVRRRDFESELAGRLEAAGVPLRAAEWLLIHLGVALGSAFLMLLISGGAIGLTLIGLTAGVLLPWVYLSIKESKRTSAFLAQLPDTLQLVSGSLSAGYSMPQAMDTVVREGQQPMTGEFNRALVEARLGVPIEDALDGIADRMRSKDFAWVVMAIRIQREVGGNLAELLVTVGGTLRERERLRRQVKVLSAEGRLSGWILGLLPPTFALYLVMTRPSYLEPLYTTLMGGVMLTAGAVLLLIGALWMRKAVAVEV